ncbi:MAG: hypothetical protein ACRD12_06310 [Acidimicrobiales bacterium]
MAGGIGLAVHLRRRFGGRVLIVPAALVVLVMVDHSLYNASVSLGNVVPGWLEGVWSAWGSGHEARRLLLVLLVVAVVVDYRILRVVTDDLPPLPARPPGAALVTSAEARWARLPRAVGTPRWPPRTPSSTPCTSSSSRSLPAGVGRRLGGERLASYASGVPWASPSRRTRPGAATSAGPRHAWKRNAGPSRCCSRQRRQRSSPLCS